ncbi:MAG TPA: nucleotidyltransferase [Cyanobacteria bacterium UBA11149]|nr:nucleotidyltransferase [Cyanobacteria bacterium UBA11367]HBE58847.1 nucleotidyltransferase [Cyanobacteria bacterium UBA11366]HBK63353.1 nucleotidyltransferase [Cyanobacteria bacterium UBA11166]HBR72336.1 nucleotidyltransferase [Cyanobacteria bacterium UBA11159]HBS70408.1 nucleotidyltransferase [Cyanobacteria bacterium UBA11153]HBW89352.1 nucleotidyltransferase [Cyanobacteria bacterium UBA11149]HCA97662.1 nucleotidyltransferase [Cyanobacteria bacterium UBA9226]
MNKEEKLKKIVASQPYPLLFATISGAHLYGFASPDSDYDVRGSHILSLPEVLRLEPRQETIEISETRDEIELDLVTHDIKKFFALLLKKNGYVLEQLYSPLIIHTTAQHQELKGIAKRCITRYHNHHYLGFARTQWHLFEKESPRRVKPLLYVYRVLLTGIHLMQTGEIEANLLALNQSFKLPYISDLIARKVAGDEQSLFGDVNLDFYQSEYNRLCQELLDVSESSWLPSAPLAKNDLNDLLVRVRLANG